MNWAWLQPQHRPDPVLAAGAPVVGRAADRCSACCSRCRWARSRFRYRWSYATLITLAGLLYTIPSLALFVVLPGILGHQDPRSAQCGGRAHPVHLGAAGPGGRRRAGFGPAAGRAERDRDGLPAAALAGHRAVAAGHPGDRGRPAGGGGVQRQPGLGRRAARYPATGPAVHRRIPARLLHPDHRRHRALPGAGRGLRRDHPDRGAARDPVDQGGEATDERRVRPG